MPAGSLNTVKTVSDVAANAATIFALLIGAGWALWIFFRERAGKPKAGLALEVSHRQLTEDEQLLHVKVIVQNTGRRRIPVPELRVDINRVLPLDEETTASVRDQGLVPTTRTEAKWPEVDGRVKKWPESERPEIEPGERDEYCFDFVVPTTLTLSSVYAYLPNVTRRDREMGWSTTTLYDISGSSGAREAEVSFGATKAPGPLRARVPEVQSQSAEQQPPRPPRPREEN